MNVERDVLNGMICDCLSTDVKDKQMSLSDRLRIEFGLETGDTYDDVNDDLGSRKGELD